MNEAGELELTAALRANPGIHCTAANALENERPVKHISASPEHLLWWSKQVFLARQFNRCGIAAAMVGPFT
jgi:hypothetical protein